MCKFAFEYFNLDYKRFINTKFQKLNRNEVKNKKSDYYKYLKINKITFKSKIFGRKLIIKMIRYYLTKKDIM